MNGRTSRTDSRHLKTDWDGGGGRSSKSQTTVKRQRSHKRMKSLDPGIAVLNIISASKSHSVPKACVQMDHLIESQGGR